MDLLCEADILIGDWSGISFEYSCALDRPVVFIDTEAKDNAETPLEMDLFENYAREEVGAIVSVHHIDRLIDVIADVFRNYVDYQHKITTNKKKLFFNCPSSSSEVLVAVTSLVS